MEITKLKMMMVILLNHQDDVILFEVGESSDDDGSDSENDKILQPRNSRTGRSCTTYLMHHFYGDSD